MPYLAVNEDGQEIICERKMVRFDPKNVIPEMKVSLKDLKSNCKKWVPIVFENVSIHAPVKVRRQTH